MTIEREMGKIALIVNIIIKALLVNAAYHFYTIGDMFLAGLCLGWIIFDVMAIIFWVIVVIGTCLE
jgi:hypothetical protein